MEGLPVASMFGRRLNTPERECFSLCFESDTNLVISVSTGSEKSGLFELCMMRNFSKFTDGKLIHMNGASKTIYVAPRNLVEQKLLDWGNKYGRLGVKCLQLKGENENYNSNLHDADVILTTSEEFDAITRSLTNDDRLSFFGKIALVLLDEVHLLSEPSGAALEAIVSRMKMWRKFMISEPEMISSPLCSVRFMAISAPIPNIHDLAEWLMVPEKGIKSFGEESGHVKQTTKVSGCTPAENDILFEKGHLDEIHLNGCVESQLLPCLREYITAEIVQLSIPDLTRAIEWLKCSFLYVRMKKNPKIYSVMTGLDLEEHTKDICVQTIEELSLRNMIRTAEDGILLEPCELGKLMTKYNLKFNTMKHIMETPVTSIKDALRSVCYAEEISGGKKCIQTREEIFILANDCLTGDSKLQKTISKGEQVESICSDGCRVAKCMKEYFVQQKVYKGALNSALLAKTLHLKLRDNSPYLLEQLPDIDKVTAKALEVEMRLEVNEQGKLGVTLTRLSQSTASTKQHYADMMISMEEEDRILFHERIRWDDFSSPPYCTTVHLPDTEPEKFTVNADLVFEEFIGDIHQTMTVAKIPSRYNIKIKGLQDILAMDEPLRLTRDRDKLKQNEELEHFVLVWIADSLSVEDFRAFREVCTSWQDAASRNNFASKTPLLMLAEKEDDSNVREFYSIFEHKICTSIAIPEAHGKRCTEVGFGWILALSPSGEMCLLSLFSTRKIGNLPNFPEVYSSARGILTADPCSASSFYFLLAARLGLFSWRSGDTTWTRLSSPSQSVVSLTTGLVCSFSWDKKGVEVWDLKNHTRFSNPKQIVQVCSIFPEDSFDRVREDTEAYLVETARGDLLVLFRKHGMLTETVQMGAQSFRVLRIDLVGGSFEEVTDIGNGTIFIGDNAAVSLDATELPEVLQPNCIYFTDDRARYFDDDYAGAVGALGVDMGIYSLTDGSVERILVDSASSSSPPFWVFPHQNTIFPG